jgi:hypothetical protein
MALTKFRGNPTLTAINGDVGALGSALLDLAEEVTGLRVQLEEQRKQIDKLKRATDFPGQAARSLG